MGINEYLPLLTDDLKEDIEPEISEERKEELIAIANQRALILNNINKKL